MRIRPTSKTGRTVEIDTAFLKARIVDGGVVVWEPRDPTPPISAIGDRYKAELTRRLGGVPCGACDAERKRLNTLHAGQVRAQRESIIEATVDRAKNLPRWRDRIRAKLGNALAPEHLRRIIGECLDHAISTTE